MPVPSGIKRSNLQLLTAAQKDKAIEVPISGRVVAKNTTTLFAEVQGKIEPSGFRFKQGVTFRKGQPLIVIDAIEFTFNLESQRSSFLNILTAMMPDMKEDYAANYKPWLAYVESYRTGEPLQALPDTRSNGEKYFVTSRGVYTSYFAIKALEERLEKYTIEAPYNGIVTQSGVDQGGLVSPGQPLGEIISTDEYELEAGVGLEVANALRPGDKLTFKSNQQPGEWIGTVVRIGGTVDSKTQNVSVFFSMSGKDLRPGTYLEGVYNTSDFEDVFVIHNSLLGRDQTVLILDQNLIVRKVVEPIEYVQDSVLIRGLQNEDQLILNQFSEPVEGQTVTLQ
ncbi:MAG: hypothetical protein Roseis2KO_51920 [Roseivirga sp.]